MVPTWCRRCRAKKGNDNHHVTDMSARHVACRHFRDFLPTRHGRHILLRVKQVVHIIRNPLDNIVSRFHHQRKKKIKENEKWWLHEFSNDKQGFQVSQLVVDRMFIVCTSCASSKVEPHHEHFLSFRCPKQKWCKSQDKDTLIKSCPADTDLVDTFDGVPCQADFFRYIQWHNLAFTVALVDLDVTTLVFHYEDYSNRFDDVTQELMDYLELTPSITEAPKFFANKTYGHYYSVEQTQAIAKFISFFSSKITWKHMERYFQ